MPNEAKPKTVKVMSNLPRVDTIGVGYSAIAGGHGTKAITIRLLPGVNEVHAESWEKAKQLKVVKHHLAEGNFKELTGVTSQGLSGMSTADAIDLVEKTLDRELLRSWLGSEKRGAVASAIEVQIDKITFKPERDAVRTDEGIDLQPTPVATGLDGAAIAQQVSPEQPMEEQQLAPVTADPPDKPSKAPVQPPPAVASQLRDVPAPKATQPARRR